MEAKPRERNISAVFHPSITPGAVREGGGGSSSPPAHYLHSRATRRRLKPACGGGGGGSFRWFERLKQTGREFFLIPDWNVRGSGNGAVEVGVGGFRQLDRETKSVGGDVQEFSLDALQRRGASLLLDSSPQRKNLPLSNGRNQAEQPGGVADEEEEKVSKVSSLSQHTHGRPIRQNTLSTIWQHVLVLLDKEDEENVFSVAGQHKMRSILLFTLHVPSFHITSSCLSVFLSLHSTGKSV